MHVADKLLLPKIQDIDSLVFGSHPQHAAAILIDGEHGVAVEAVRIDLLVLKSPRETLRATIEVGEALARRHPESPVAVRSEDAVERAAARRRRQSPAGVDGKGVARRAPGQRVISHQADDRRTGQHPENASVVFIHAVCAEAFVRSGPSGNRTGLRAQVEQTMLAGEPDVSMRIGDDLSDPPEKLPITIVPIMA